MQAILVLGVFSVLLEKDRNYQLHFFQDSYVPVKRITRHRKSNADELTRQAWNGNPEKQVEDDLLPEEGDVGNLT